MVNIMFSRGMKLKQGYTLIEVLVVVAIMGVLFSMLVLAISSARESARRLQCQNNLHQIGLACASYSSIWRSLPPAAGFRRTLQHSPFVAILPNLDMDGMYDELKDQEVINRDSPPFVQGISRPSVLNCPSDIEDGSNYRACTGSTILPYFGSRSGFGGDGVFVLNKCITEAAVSDGLSLTALFSERLQGTGSQSKGTCDYLGVTPHFPDADEARELLRFGDRSVGESNFAGREWKVGGFLHSWYCHVDSPNPPRDGLMDSGVNESYVEGAGAVAASSHHPSGVNVCRADGSVHFASSSIDLEVWRAAGTISKNETVRWE
jgi:prepilin-type N-terminal cleavage/methylation domain-containing protein